MVYVSRLLFRGTLHKGRIIVTYESSTGIYVALPIVLSYRWGDKKLDISLPLSPLPRREIYLG